MKILLIQLRQLGDVLMTTPATRQLRSLYPNAEIVFMTEPLGANAYRHSPHISRLWVVERKLSAAQTIALFWRVWREKFDLVIDFFCNPKSAQIAFFSRAKERVGFDFRYRGYAYARRVALTESGEYAARSKNRLIAHLGGRVEDDAIECFCGAEDEKFAENFAAKHNFGDRAIALCAVSRRSYKLLEPSFWATVGDALIAAGWKLWLVYGPGERAMAQAVFDLLANKRGAIVDYEMPSVLELRAILAKCRLYVGNDGGSKHLSVCAGTPTVTVFHTIKAPNWTATGQIAFQAEEGIIPCQVLKSCMELLCLK